MRNELTVRFSGEQGSGVQLTGRLGADYFTRCGYFVFGVNEFESRIIGGYSFIQLSISVKKIASIKQTPDICISFSKSAVKNDEKTISKDTLFIIEKTSDIDNSGGYKRHQIDFSCLKGKVERAYKNIFYLSLTAGLLGTDKDILMETIRSFLEKKGKDVLKKNIDAAELGYNYNTGISIDLTKPEHEKPEDKEKVMSCSGSYAVSLGALVSNCRFYSAYPMSPSTSVMNNLSLWSEEAGIVVEQAEDEIAALNMSLGASYAGVRSMTGTSGGGMALMSETVSLAAISEIPIVILNAQRPAPATGLPTRTEQADLFFTLHMGHGEFTKVIFAPGSHEKAFELVQKGFYIAEKYQVPVFILTDQYIMDSISTERKWKVIHQWKERFVDTQEGTEQPYLRYRFTKTGISPRRVPGFTDQPVVADSHTHEESGFITERSDIREKGVKKLLVKEEYILRDISPPYISSKEQKKNIIIGWGSTFGVIKDALDILTCSGSSVCHIHFHEVYPLHTDLIIDICRRGCNIICVENNATGQLGKLIKLKTGIDVDEYILKFNGRPFYRDELVDRLGGVLK